MRTACRPTRHSNRLNSRICALLRFTAVFAMLSLVLGSFVPVLASASPALAAPRVAGVSTIPSVGAPAAGRTDLGDAHELESFLDGVVSTQLAAYHIPGATVSVVKDGQLLLAKGYGSADLVKGTPVRADTTAFRVGSVSKLFTWTAVMQLKEQGKLDLNTDVNHYLMTFQIPDTYPGHPITLAHLLTHTPGFEDHGMGTGVHGASEMQPLGTWLAHNIPARVRPPGVVTSYSNYGATLAGYIVQQVSGQPFDDYIEQHILQPLGMSRSTFRQPVPQALAASLATGYSYSDGTYSAQPFEYVAPWPAGSMSTTATDMATFMIAQLQNGRSGDTRILQDVTAREMHTQHFSNDPRVPGFDYGFYEQRIAGQRIIMHWGDTLMFHAELALLPERNVGLFVSVNSMSGETAPAALVDAFVSRYFNGGSSALPTTALPGYANRAAKMAGSYWATRHSYTTLEKVTMLFSTMTVTTTGNGHLSISPGMGSAALDVVEVAPWTFRQVRPQDFWLDVGTIVFQTDGSGNVTSVLLGNVPMMAWQRIAWYETPGFHFLVILICLLLFLAALLVWPARFLLNPRGRQRIREAISRMFAWVTRRRTPPATARKPALVRSGGAVATSSVADGPANGGTGGQAAPEAGPVEQSSPQRQIRPPAQVYDRPYTQPKHPTIEPAAVAASGRGGTLGMNLGTHLGLTLGGRRLSREGLGRLAHCQASVVSALFILFAITFGVVLTSQNALVFGATPLLIVGLLLGMLAAIVTLGVLACAVLIWREHVWNPAARIFYALVALAAVAFVWELAFWNLLGVHL